MLRILFLRSLQNQTCHNTIEEESQRNKVVPTILIKS
ncbi:hypothetical protein SHEWT2_02765 [Shewanella hafniensis]|nr:hypothetical protein SHEWT2_02765 [Shewanella hafniensis]